MKLRKSLSKAGIIASLILLCFPKYFIYAVDIDKDLEAHPVFSNQFATYFYDRATTEYQHQIVSRILDLEVEIDQAKEIISRVPFLEVDERLHLFRLLDKRYQSQMEAVANESKDGRVGFISLGEEKERRKILKKFLLTKVKTEEEYQKLILAFEANPKILDLFMHVRNLNFLNESDRSLAKKIAHGQLEAYFNQSVKSSEYSQQLEVSNVENKGFTLDLAKQTGEYGRYRHQFRSADTFKGNEFYAEVATEAGNDSLRDEDKGQLEYLRLEWKGDKSGLLIGDQLPKLSDTALNREIRGVSWSRKFSDDSINQISVFAGVTPVSLQNLNSNSEEFIRGYGFGWNKDFKSGKNIGIYYINANESRQLGSRDSQIIGFNHSSKLSRQLSFYMDLNRNYNSQLSLDKVANGFSLGINYMQDELSAKVDMKRFERGYFSLLGHGIPSTVEMDAFVKRYESWGSWKLFSHFHENQEESNVLSMEVFRPGVHVHLNNFLGLKDLYADYGYDESREESSDLSLLFESNNHWLQVSKTFHRLKFDMSINYRESFDKNTSLDSDKEGQIRFSTQGHFFLNGRAISPLVEVSSHRQQLVNGRVDNRQAGALQLTSQIFNRGQVFFSL